MKPNILIAVPAYGGSIKRECANSISELESHLHALNITFRRESLDMANIANARDLFVKSVLDDKAITHLLQIDHDIAFRPRAFTRMLELNQPVVGCAYPQRRLDVRKMYDLARAGEPLPRAIAKASRFVININDGAHISNGACLVNGFGMGLSLIQRGAFEKLLSTDLVAQMSFNGKPYFGFFQYIDDLGEDMSFCRRWIESGGECYAIVDEPVGHIGEFVFAARFIDAVTKQ